MRGHLPHCNCAGQAPHRPGAPRHAMVQNPIEMVPEVKNVGTSKSAICHRYKNLTVLIRCSVEFSVRGTSIEVLKMSKWTGKSPFFVSEAKVTDGCGKEWPFLVRMAHFHDLTFSASESASNCAHRDMCTILMPVAFQGFSNGLLFMKLGQKSAVGRLFGVIFLCIPRRPAVGSSLHSSGTLRCRVPASPTWFCPPYPTELNPIGKRCRRRPPAAEGSFGRLLGHHRSCVVCHSTLR